MRLLQNKIALYTRLQWCLGLALVGSLVVFYLLPYKSGMERLEKLNRQIKSKQSELARNRSKARDLPLLAFGVRQLESQVQNYDRQFPKQPELGQFIRDITLVSQHQALQEWKYQPGAPRRQDNYYELPVQMNFHGDFRNVAGFLREVEDMRRLTRVKRLVLKSRDYRTGSVEAEVAMSIYFSEG